MENQQTKQSETSSEQSKKGNGGKRLPMTGFGLGIIATAFTIICLMMFACSSSSRPSTPSEIAIEIEFQSKFKTALEEFHQTIAAATNEAEQKSDSFSTHASSSRFSSLSEIAAQIELQDNLQTAIVEFKQKVDAATKEAEQKSEPIGK